MNFTWWVNRKDADGSNVFEGGFLGLDNIGPIDRSHLLRRGTRSSSPTRPAGWRFYALSMAAIASVLDRRGRRATDLVVKFLEHFALISEAMKTQGLWDEEDGFYYDRLRRPDGSVAPGQGATRWSGVLPLMAFAVVDERVLQRAQTLGKQFARLLARRHSPSTSWRARDARQGRARAAGGCCSAWSTRRTACGSSPGCSTRRSSSRRTGCGRCRAGTVTTPTTSRSTAWSATIDYEPAESTTGMFGGNSNWRGPIWFPVNYLVVERSAAVRALLRRQPSPSSTRPARAAAHAEAVGEDLRRRLISLFLVGRDGRRPCFGEVERFQQRSRLEGQRCCSTSTSTATTARASGASHQTGWTGIVADLDPAQRRRRRSRRSPI